MTGWPSPSEDRLLRAIEPPPMRDDFAARVMARLPADASSLPPVTPRRRERRGPWMRTRTLFLSGAAAGLLSVAAAASGLLGVEIRNMPVISSIAAVVAPAPRLLPEKKKAAPATKAKVAPVIAVESPPAIARPEPLIPSEIRREMIAERMAQRLERRAERRKTMGLPPVDPALRKRLRERLRTLPPEERRAVIQRLREIRRARLEARDVEPQFPSWRERRRARIEPQVSAPPEQAK